MKTLAIPNRIDQWWNSRLMCEQFFLQSEWKAREAVLFLLKKNFLKMKLSTGKAMLLNMDYESNWHFHPFNHHHIIKEVLFVFRSKGYKIEHHTNDSKFRDNDEYYIIW